MFDVTSSVSPIAPDKEKDSPEYGLKLLKAATEKWETGYNGESRLARKTRFDYNRSYMLAKYDMQEFKDILDLDGELSVVNLPYDQLTEVIPYINRLKDKYNQRDEVIQCNAVDPFLQGKKKAAKDNAKFKLRQKENIMALQQQAGVPVEEFNEGDPQSEAEIDVEYGFNYKEREEVIMENLINVVFYENDWSGVIKDRLMDDLIACGYAGTKTYIDGTGRIKIRPLKPENIITSYTEWNDFRDWQYLGEIYYMSIMEVRLKYPGKISEEDLYKLSTSLVGKYGNPANSGFSWSPLYANSTARPYDAWRVPVVELSFKTLYNLKKTIITNSFGKENIVKPESVTNPNADTKALNSNEYYVEYTGAYILGTEHLLEWGLSKNMVKPNQNLEEIISPYTLYMYNNNEMSNKPMAETLIPIIKEMQLYKLQQLKIVAAAAPDGYDIDIATMSDISLDGGTTTMSPIDLYKVYKQTGNKYFKSIPDEGLEGGGRRVPIQANNVPFSSKLESLGQLYNSALLRLTNVISNELDAGNIRNQAVGANVLEQAKKTGESTSNFIYNSFLNIMQRTAKVVQLRGWDILMYGKKFGVQFYDGYKMLLGENRIEYLKLEATSDWGKTAYDVQIKTVIGDAQQMALENNIQTALTNNKIEFHDAIDIRELAHTNIKYAAYVLSQRIEKRQKQAQDNAMQLAQQNTQAATAGAEAKIEGEMKLEALRAKNKEAEDLRAQNRSLTEEQEKFNSILKVEIAKAVLAQPGKTINDIPTFVFEGLPTAKAIDHAATMQFLQTMAQNANIALPEQPQQMDGAMPQPKDEGHVSVIMPDGSRGMVPHDRYHEFYQQYPEHEVEQPNYA